MNMARLLPATIAAILWGAAMGLIESPLGLVLAFVGGGICGAAAAIIPPIWHD